MGQFIYFIQAGDDGPIKIGTAGNVTTRLRSMQGGNAQELHILGFFECNTVVEAMLHGQFQEGRIRGEWFEPDTFGLDAFISAVRRGALPDWVTPYLPEGVPDS